MPSIIVIIRWKFETLFLKWFRVSLRLEMAPSKGIELPRHKTHSWKVITDSTQVFQKIRNVFQNSSIVLLALFQMDNDEISTFYVNNRALPCIIGNLFLWISPTGDFEWILRSVCISISPGFSVMLSRWGKHLHITFDRYVQTKGSCLLRECRGHIVHNVFGGLEILMERNNFWNKAVSMCILTEVLYKYYEFIIFIKNPNNFLFKIVSSRIHILHVRSNRWVLIPSIACLIRCFIWEINVISS